MPGLSVELGMRREFGGRYFDGYAYFPQNGTRDKGSVKFNVSGDSEIFILGRSNDDSVTRHYVLYDWKDWKKSNFSSK